MDNPWLQIGSTVVLGLMLFFLYPTARHWMQNGPKAKKGDWASAIFPLSLVIGFVILLIALV